MLFCLKPEVLYGISVPLDFKRNIDTHWDLVYIWDNLKHYLDQELVSMLLQGVQYKTDLDLQIVLLPHLISFGAGCQLIHKQVVEYTKSGWYSIHDFLPFLPMRNIPRAHRGPAMLRVQDQRLMAVPQGTRCSTQLECQWCL